MDLFDKAAQAGIQTEFIDAQGHRRVTDVAAIEAVLDALAVQSPRRLIKAAVVARAGEHSTTELGGDAAFPVTWEIRSGAKIVRKGETRERSIHWPSDLPAGSYQLHLTDASSVE